MNYHNKNNKYGWYSYCKPTEHLHTEADINLKHIAPAAALSLGLFGNAPHDNKSPKQNQKEIQIDTKNKNNAPSFQEVRNFIGEWEGVRNKAYKDSKGIWTIGIGFNLERSDADKILASIGTTKKNLIGGQVLSKEQISILFNTNYKTALNDAINWIPNLREHPKAVQLIIIDFSFNLGATKLNKFPKAKKALIDKNYSVAAKELETSKWYKDVARRGVNHVKTLRSYANEKNRT
jgi:GH24 family phage-related lysozyme (muramidase)